jgi:hypothetical protein
MSPLCFLFFNQVVKIEAAVFVRTPLPDRLSVLSKVLPESLAQELYEALFPYNVHVECIRHTGDELVAFIVR